MNEDEIIINDWQTPLKELEEEIRKAKEEVGDAVGRPTYAFPRVPRGVRAMPVKTTTPRLTRGWFFCVQDYHWQTAGRI